MKHKVWRLTSFIAVLAFAVISIVATSPPLPPFLLISTVNNPKVENIYYEPRTVSFACLNEQVTMRWEYPNEEGRLTASPLQNTEPQLKNRQLKSEETLQVTILGEVSITVPDADSYTQDYTIRLIPEDTCTGYPVNPLGFYGGSLSQSKPEVRSLERELRLYWQEDYVYDEVTGEGKNVQVFYANIGSPDATPDRLSCETVAAEDRIRCSREENGLKLFELDGLISDSGFVGRYSGVASNAVSGVSFEGTFSFIKSKPE